jgi:hypothetical protein
MEWSSGELFQMSRKLVLRKFMLEGRFRTQDTIFGQLVHQLLGGFGKFVVVENDEAIELLVEVVHEGVVVAIEAGAFHAVAALFPGGDLDYLALHGFGHHFLILHGSLSDSDFVADFGQRLGRRVRLLFICFTAPVSVCASC